MSYDEEEQRRSRVVVETPTERREVVHTQTTRTPEREGFSTGMVAAVAMAAIAATALIFLFLMNRSDDTANTNVSISTQPTPVAQSTIIIQQPATQPTPIIIQQAPPTTITQPAPVVITQPPPATTPATTPSVPDDATLQSDIDKEFENDADISITDVTATMLDGKATLIGTVKSQELKRRAEKLAYKIKGVRSVDNRIVVEGTSLTVP
ncbi:MAG: BON domain-containing protein [Acidobacteriota bacterium]|nr:BON domain-containing protein [Acidobacteriota bacterium]